MTTLEVGHRILKKMGFQLEHEFLGAGSFGGVFRVVDEEGNNYALKMQKTSEFNDREWETSQKIRSAKCPYLIEHIQLEKHTEYVYLQLEYANSRSLQELLVAKRCGMNIFTLRLMWQMLIGVSVLHTNKIIHRDLKAENILCNSSPTGEITMKISDFGLARTVSSEGQAKTQCGTPLHMAPEIFAGVDYGAQADVWSLGVLFFQMAVNNQVHPFPAQSFPELVEMINKPITRNPALFPAPQSDAWWDVIHAMLCVRMTDRPTVDAVLAMPLFAKYKTEADFLSPSVVIPGPLPPVQLGKKNKAGVPAPPPPGVLPPDTAIISTFPYCTNHYLHTKGGSSGGSGGAA